MLKNKSQTFFNIQKHGDELLKVFYGKFQKCTKIEGII